MFHPVTSLDIPTGSDLLAEIGVARHTVHEIAEDERAIRCPDRGAVYPEHGFAGLYPELAFGTVLQDAAPADPWDPASSLFPAE